MTYIVMILLITFIMGCSAVPQPTLQIFKVGELEVRIYGDRGEMVRDLPVLLSLIEATRVEGRKIKVLGYYDKKGKRIYSIDDVRVLLHELKHHLEPGWRHPPLGCPNLCLE